VNRYRPAHIVRNVSPPVNDLESRGFNMKRLTVLMFALVGALVAVAPATAQEVTPTAPQIAADVTIGDVAVGGMSVEHARAAVQTAFDQPLAFSFKKRKWKATPAQLGARPRIEAALAQAAVAAPGTSVGLISKIQGKKVRKYVAYLERVFDRPVRDTRVRVIKSKPRYSKARNGVVVSRKGMITSIMTALRNHDRGPIALEAELIAPKITAKNFGAVVVIKRETKELHYYRGTKLVRKFDVATGLAQYSTPIGGFAVINKQENPTWYPPPTSDWVTDPTPVPPGPGNPLGTRWMGISSPLIGIHGTPDAASIGYSRSHGCIRMRVSEAEWLFDNVDVGTPIFITRQ